VDQDKTILSTKTKSSQTKKNSHLCLPFPPFPSPIHNSWKALSLNVLILGRWDMGIYPFPQNFLTFIQISFFLHLLIFWVYFIFIVTGASITEEDAGFELLVVMRFTHAVIVITRQRYFFFLLCFNLFSC
jgi:hypothetical protein